MDEYISKKTIYDIIYKYQRGLQNMGVILALDAIGKEVLKAPAADVQPVIRGDNCIVCGRNVHKDDVYYDVNGGTICEVYMNTKCKCKNGR